MLSLFPIAATDGGSIVWLVVIAFFVISQLVKAARRKSGGEPEAPADGAGEYRSPEDELQEFLKSLGKGGARPEEQRAEPVMTRMPPPLPVKTGEAQRAGGTAAQVRTVAAAQTAASQHESKQASPVIVRPEPVFVPEPAPVAVAVPVRQLGVKDRPVMGRHDFGAQLRVKDSLRSAIVLREILGPPLALRRQDLGSTGYGAV